MRRLHLYLHRFEQAGGRLIGAEPHFEVAIPIEESSAIEESSETPHRVLLSGYIDRVELTPEGTVVIMDLKTGKREPQTDLKVLDNPQLAAYQLAFESGAIPEADGLAPGGAKRTRALNMTLSPASIRPRLAEATTVMSPPLTLIFRLPPS